MSLSTYLPHSYSLTMKPRIFVWEIFPEWIFPLLTGFSVFCLANPTSEDFTRIFGGSNGNEGLGLLSVCFDWQYISGGVNPFVIPLKAQFSNFLGYLLCMYVSPSCGDCLRY